ncbi:MAG TPA: hypothetical protein VGY54_01815 [Polyangiaceae bacterium]|nr:hypothetical protein [Polyangiaceae bacterium]
MSILVPAPAHTPIVGIVPELAPEPVPEAAPEAEPEVAEPEPPAPDMVEPEVASPEPPAPDMVEPEVTSPDPPPEPVELPEPTVPVPVPPHPALAAIDATNDNDDVACAKATHFVLCMHIDLLSGAHEVKENRGQITQFTNSTSEKDMAEPADRVRPYAG